MKTISALLAAMMMMITLAGCIVAAGPGGPPRGRVIRPAPRPGVIVIP